MNLKTKIGNLLKQLNEGVYEKQEVIALALLTAIAGESIFLLGAPGVAKSLIARRLKFAFADKNGKKPIAFEYLMNRFSTPDEIFGPVSISQLKEDKYVRLTENYLPSASVVFLDEIWKAGPSIQNSLLTVLNERKYRNGDSEIDVPMKALISASNELPMKDHGLEALWDRFLIRYVVGGIEDKQNFNDMISSTHKSVEDNVSSENKITHKQYENFSGKIDGITMPENIYNVIHIIRGHVELHNRNEENKENQIYVSDRRWKKIVRILRASAFINGRKSVDLMDCFLISNCIWNDPKQCEAVLQFTKGAVEKHGYKLDIDTKDLYDEITSFDADVKSETSFLKDVMVEEPKLFGKEYYEIQWNSSDDRYIRKDDYELLTKSDKQIYFYYKYYDSFRAHNTFNIKRGKKNHIIINGTEYSLKTFSKEAQKKATKRPHTAVKNAWDKKVKELLAATGKLKSQIKKFRNTDLKHVRVNLFVNPTLAEVVECNLNDLHNEIEKIEVEMLAIQYYYENVENQVEPKQPELKETLVLA